VALALGRRSPLWIAVPATVAALALAPIVFVAAHLLDVPVQTVSHLVNTVLPRYALNTVVLLAGSMALSLLFGVCAAWLVSAYDFPGRRLFEGALLLPLGLPPYIAAFAYAGIFGYTGPLQVFFRNTLKLQAYPVIEVMSLGGALFVLGSVLYPYVYLAARSAFRAQAGPVLEVARSLACSPGRALGRLLLPLARPALVGGLALVGMEVLSDYGTASYYGVDTFTTAILRTWLSRGRAGEAAHLAGWLLALVGGLLLLERLLRGEARFALHPGQARPAVPARLRGPTAAAAAAVCAVPVAAGFLLPVSQLLWWAVLSWGRTRLALAGPAFNSALLAVSATALILVLAVLLSYAARLAGGGWRSATLRLATLGYSIPGPVLALGVMLPVAWFDHRLANALEALTGQPSGLLLSGTPLVLLGAIAVRFLAVAYHPLEAGLERTARRAGEVALSLGHSPLGSLLRVELPLLAETVAFAGLVVCLEALKELPLTLILRPFNFHTLATRAYELAVDEQLPAASHGSLLIAAIGTLIVLALNRMARRRS